MSGWRRFRTQRGALPGLVALGLLAGVALAAPLCASDLPLAVRVDGHTYWLPCLVRPPALRDDDQQSLAGRSEWVLTTFVPFGPLAPHPGGIDLPLAPPSSTHWLGTDEVGRDVAARLIHGTRTALLVGALAVLLGLALGLTVGFASALSPLADAVLGRLIEVGLVVPAFFLLLALQATVTGSGGLSLVEVAAAIAFTRWPEVARLTRAEALRVVALPHVEAARALGLQPSMVALRHVLPLASGPALVVGALGLGQAVLVEAGLAFLGFGVPPPTPSWGELLAEAQANGLPWWLLLPPSLCIGGVVLAASRVADGLRATLDPRPGAPPC